MFGKKHARHNAASAERAKPIEADRVLGGKKFYITTTLPYVNADPHIGFALEIIQADVLARYHKNLGEDVFFNTGVDEHGLKIFRKAQESNMDAHAYCDVYAKKFDDLKRALNLSYNNFIRTTDERHIKAAQEFWLRCQTNGDIYKKNYKSKYCVGCEMEKTNSELENGRCPVHPNLELEIIDEENYFFKLSKYQDKLIELYKKNYDFVIPQSKLNEISEFAKRGLQDFSISRLKEKLPWGVPVPGDDKHVMYVWFDALVNYISCLGWPKDQKKFKDFWPGTQIAGKDNLRHQALMWQAMLMSAGLPNSKQVFIHGFITAGGQKMSKSLGNVIDPVEVVNTYGVDAVRYYLLGGLPSYDDGDFTIEKFEEFYTAHLVNGVGNLTARIVTVLEKYHGSAIPALAPSFFDVDTFWSTYDRLVGSYRFDELVLHVNTLVAYCDKYINDEKLWETKKPEVINDLFYTLDEISNLLLPFLPETAEKIKKAVSPPAVGKKSEALFPRV